MLKLKRKDETKSAIVPISNADKIINIHDTFLKYGTKNNYLNLCNTQVIFCVWGERWMLRE